MANYNDEDENMLGVEALDRAGLDAAKKAYAETLYDDNLGDAEYVVRAYRAALSTAGAADPVDGPEEIEIDRLRLAAFQAPTNENKAAYYMAISKWFQDRHYRRLASPPSDTEEKGL
jgi:hypothetical protein